jgi:hypothetical protein
MATTIAAAPPPALVAAAAAAAAALLVAAVATATVAVVLPAPHNSARMTATIAATEAELKIRIHLLAFKWVDKDYVIYFS